MKNNSKFSQFKYLIFLLIPTFASFGSSQQAHLYEDNRDEHAIAPQFNTPSERQELESFSKELSTLENLYVDPTAVKKNSLIERALTGMASHLDPHTVYLTPEQFAEFNSNFTKKSDESNFEFKQLSQGYAYMRLNFFQKDVAVQIGNRVREFMKKNDYKTNGIIFDLRDNPGGLLDESIKVTDLFINHGIIVSIMGRGEQKPKEIKYAQEEGTLPNFPLIVLVNERTASSSEIVASALQDSGRAIIMGTKTYGKGSIQDIVVLPNGGALKLTTAHYFSPKGKSIQAVGVLPDIPLVSQKMLAATEQFSKDRKSIREEDLKNRMGQLDFQETMGQQEKRYQEIDGWPNSLKNDYQVRLAYVYFKNIQKYAAIQPKSTN